MKYKLHKISDKIFFVECKDKFDLAMLFCRTQEFYESPKFKGKLFKMIEFITWYSKQNNNNFSYANDWGGFNIPSATIKECLKYTHTLDDMTIYDEELQKIHNNILKLYHTENYCLIGATSFNSTFKHELAHSFYYSDPEYKAKMKALIKTVPNNLKTLIYSEFKKLGYHKSVFDDELQAYMSTGLSPLNLPITKLKGFQKKFTDIYNSYYKQIKKKL